MVKVRDIFTLLNLQGELKPVLCGLLAFCDNFQLSRGECVFVVC